MSAMPGPPPPPYPVSQSRFSTAGPDTVEVIAIALFHASCSAHGVKDSDRAWREIPQSVAETYMRQAEMSLGRLNTVADISARIQTAEGLQMPLGSVEVVLDHYHDYLVYQARLMRGAV